MKTQAKVDQLKSLLKESDISHQKKQEQLKIRLSKAKDRVAEEAEKWQCKLTKLEEEISEANDLIYNQKIKHRRIVQQHIDEASHNQQLMQNYIDSLEETNATLTEELRSAISEKHTAERKTAKAKKLAADRLQKWHDKRNQRREAQDLGTLHEKAAREYEAILQDYKSTTQDISAKCRKNGQTKMLPPVAVEAGGGQYGSCNSFVSCL